MAGTIRAFDGAGVRAARAVSDAATSAVLALLGMAITPAGSSGDVALADALFTVGEALGLAPPAEVIAFGRVRDEVPLRGHVEASAQDVAAFAKACGARAVVVAPDDANPRTSIAEALRAELPLADVMGVVTLGEAADRVFDLSPRARAGTLVPEPRRAAARVALFQAAVYASRAALEWPLVADLAVGLLRDADDALAVAELELVRDVARRHAGGSVPMVWPEEELLAGRSAEERFAILAHAVQSAADGAWEAVPEYVARARAAVGQDHGPGALRLRGAAGRALAAVGLYDEAGAELAVALEGWLALGCAGDASYALCEGLRIAGLLGRGEEVCRLRAMADREVMPFLDDHSKPYVDAAIGRALTQVGEHAAAASVLASPSLGKDAPVDVQAAALRWRAAASRGLGDARAVRESLEALEALGEHEQVELARLDVPSITADERRAALERLLDRADEARRLARRVAPGVGAAVLADRPAALERLRAEYRY